MWDPDAVAPSYVHQLIVNMPNKRTLDGTTVLPYTPPAPPPGTGTHRYITVLFKQPRSITLTSMKRANFNVTNFINAYDLEPIRESMFTINS